MRKCWRMRSRTSAISGWTRSPATCEGYLNRRIQQGAHPWTVSRERGFLCAVWNRAIANRKTTSVSDNPWREVKAPKCHPRTQVLGREDQARMMATASPEYQRLMTVLLLTGLRANEFLQLRLADIKKGEIHIRWQTSKGDKERFVPMLPEVAEAIKEQAKELTRTAFDRLWSQTDWAVLKQIKRIAKRAGVEDWKSLRTHDFRRTFGTRCAEAGMPMVRLANIMGHAGTQTTEKYYVHLRKEDNRASFSPRLSPVSASQALRIPAGRDSPRASGKCHTPRRECRV